MHLVFTFLLENVKQNPKTGMQPGINHTNILIFLTFRN